MTIGSTRAPARRRPGRFGSGRALRRSLVAGVVAILAASVAVPAAQADPVGTVPVTGAGTNAAALVGTLNGGLLWNVVSTPRGGLIYQSNAGALTPLAGSTSARTCGTMVIDSHVGGVLWRDVETGESAVTPVGGSTQLSMTLLYPTHRGWLAWYGNQIVYAVDARTGQATATGLPSPALPLMLQPSVCSRTQSFVDLNESVWQVDATTGATALVHASQAGESVRLLSAWEGSVAFLRSSSTQHALIRHDAGAPEIVLRAGGPPMLVGAALSTSDTYFAWQDPVPGACAPLYRQPVGGQVVTVTGGNSCMPLATTGTDPILMDMTTVMRLVPNGAPQPMFAIPHVPTGWQPRQSAGRGSWIGANSHGVSSRVGSAAALGPVSTSFASEYVLDIAVDGRHTVAGNWSGGLFGIDGGLSLQPITDYTMPVTFVGHQLALTNWQHQGPWVFDLANGSAHWTDSARALSAFGPVIVDAAGTSIYGSFWTMQVSRAEAGMPSTGRFVDVVADGNLLAWTWVAQDGAHLGQMGVGWRDLQTGVIHTVPVPAGVALTGLSAWGSQVMVAAQGAWPAIQVFDAANGGVVLSDSGFRGWDPTIGSLGLTWVAPTGEIRLAPLPDQHRPPRHEGNPILPDLIFVGGHPSPAEWVFDQPLTTCSAAVRNSAAVLVRTVPCDSRYLSVGEAQVAWDGLDGAGQPVPPGDYTYVLTAGDADGSTEASGGTVQVLSLDAFVVAAYEDFLGRTPSPEEVAFQTHAIVTGLTTREGFLRSLAMSNEWLSAIVTVMYADTLGRAPDAAGLATWVGWLQTGRFNVAQVAALFYSSDEFYLGLGGGTAQSWVTTLYHDLLGREPDAAGLAQWAIWADDPSRGRAWVATQFYGSLESRLVRVRDLYQALLGRDPDPTGWPFWADAIQRIDDVELAVVLASSDEYYLRAQG